MLLINIHKLDSSDLSNDDKIQLFSISLYQCLYGTGFPVSVTFLNIINNH